jgi:hypothetical protein
METDVATPPDMPRAAPFPPPSDPEPPKGYTKVWNTDNPYHLTVCDRDGTVVWDPAAHDRWHDQHP